MDTVAGNAAYSDPADGGWGPVDESSVDDVPFKLPRRELEEADMDITPMIDITFLLLIFFLVASRVDSQTEIPLPAAENGTAVATKNSVILSLTEGPGDSVTIYKADGSKSGTELTSSDPVDQEGEIVTYVEEAMSQGKEAVILKAEKSVKHREIARVAKAIGQVEGAKLYVAVLEQSD